MFTTGRIIFAISFIVLFIGLMIYSYRKDAKNHQKYYKNAGIKALIWSVLVITAFLLFRYHGAIRELVFGS